MNRVLEAQEVKIIQMLRASCPKNEDSLRALGLKLKLLDHGLYRAGYEIEGTDLIIKIPRGSTHDVEHSETEVKIWKKILRSPLAIQVPPLRYSNQHGMVVTDRVQIQRDTDSETQERINNWKNTLAAAADGIQRGDLHPANVGVYNRRFVVTDLGCFYERT